MNANKKVRYWATGAVICALIAAGLWQLRSAVDTAPKLNEVLDVSPSGSTMRLYSGALDPKTEKPLEAKEQSYDVLGTDRKKIASFIRNKDGTTEDIYFQDDPDKLVLRKTYYSPEAGVRGRRPRSLFIYEADGKTSHSEEWYRINGTREKVGHRRQDGDYQEFTLFEDGHTAATEKLLRPDQYATNFEPKLVLERHWLNDANHSLVYIDRYNEDETRDQKEYDEHQNLLLERHLGRWSGSGTYVKAYFPGTGNLRLEGSYHLGQIEGKIYTPDGRILCGYDSTAGRIEVTYYDATGTIPLFKQHFYKLTETTSAGTTVRWVFGWVVELAADGTPVREVEFYDDDRHVPVTVTRYNVTIAGVTHDKVIYYYRDDGTLEKVEIWTPGPNQVIETHTSAENIRLDAPPQDWFRPLVFYPEFPVPPVQEDNDGP